MLIAARLSKAGYGTVEQILQLDALQVMTLIHYETFVNEYEEEFVQLNKETT